MNTVYDAVPIKPYSVSQLAYIYGVKNRIIRNWIAPHQQSIGEKIGHLYTALQVKIIFEKLGLPGQAND